MREVGSSAICVGCPYEICGDDFKERKSAELLDVLEQCSAVRAGAEQAGSGFIRLMMVQMSMTETGE